jgi:DNA-binding MarR family transcriptional regulator
MGDISKDINSKFPNIKVKASLNILYTANWIKNKQVLFFKNYGISPQQYNVLRILKGADKPLKVQVVKERMVEKSPNATRLMDKLCYKNLIKRVHSVKDRRVVYVEIKKEGLSLLQEISLHLLDNPLSNLTDNEAELLSNLLDKIR